MPRKRFTETSVEEPTEEGEIVPDETVPEESNLEEEAQIEEAPVNPKNCKVAPERNRETR